MWKFILLFFIVASILAVYSQLPDNKLHIFVCDVGQGDGILITRGSMQMVVDAGPDNSIENCLGSHMPFWDRTIEVALMTHPDSDHYFGFTQMAKRYKINEFIGSTIENSGVEYQALKKVISDQKIKVLGVEAGEEIKNRDFSFKIIFPTDNYLSDNTTFREDSEILGSRKASSTNDYCAIGYLTYGKFTALFTCDTSPKVEKLMLDLGIVPHAYFLKVSHHGSKNGLTTEFLNAVSPKISAISVGKKNRYGHPSPEVIQMLKDFGVPILRTDEIGDIEISTDGKKVWVGK